MLIMGQEKGDYIYVMFWTLIRIRTKLVKYVKEEVKM